MKLLFRLALIFLPLTTFSQDADSIWIRNNYYKIERSIPMRDGVKLFTSIYIPKDSSEKHPILLQELLTVVHLMEKINTKLIGTAI